MDILPKALNPVRDKGRVGIFVFLDEGLNTKFKFLNSFKCSKNFIFLNLDKFAIGAGLSKNSYQCRILNSSDSFTDFQYMFPSEDLFGSLQFKMFNTVILKSVDLRKR